ncbi:MAG: hypothetical protein H6565_16755 [Lewinellaceae bacterium]|nr:hypothetical protein [Lewinellaceae bacterium]
MNPKVRTVLAVVAGIVVGGIVISAVEMFSPHHPPADLDFNDKDKVAEWIRSLPSSAFTIALLACFLGAVAAGWVANTIANAHRPALVAGFGLFAAGVFNLIAIPHPVWFAIVSSLLYFAGAWAGGRMVQKTIQKRSR